MMLKGQDASHIAFGNSFTEDGHEGAALRLPARQPAVRGGVEEGRGRRSQDEAREARLRRPVRRRAAADQRRLVPVPAAHDLEDEAGRGGRLAARHRLQRLAAVHRRGRLGRVGDPPLDHRERLARSRRRPARPALLQHRHLDLLLGRHQPQVARAARQGAARRRPRVLREDAQEPRREAQGDQPPTRSTRSPASTATSRRASRSRSSPTRRSGSCGSPSSAAPAALGGHRRHGRRLATSKAYAKLDRGRPGAPRRAASTALHGLSTTDRKEAVAPSRRLGSARQGHREGGLGRARGPRPRRPGRSPTEGRAGTRPRPPRQRERPAPWIAGRATRPTRPTGSPRRVPHRRRRLHRRPRCCPYVARRLGRPRQDQDRLRDPAHPALLPVRPAAPLAEIDAEIKALEAEIQDCCAR